MADPKKAKRASIFPDGKLPERYLQFRPAIKAAAKKYDIPEAVLWGLLHKESSGRADIGVGEDKHGHGPFQIDDRSHAKWLAKNDASDPSASADYAAQIMAENRRRLGGNMDKAVAAYNAGVGGVRKGLRAGKTLDQITFKPRYASGVTSSGAEITSLLPPEAQDGVGGAGFPPPGPVAQEAPNWEELLGRYAPQSAQPPQPVAPMGLGVSTNPLLMAMEAIKASSGDTSSKTDIDLQDTAPPAPAETPRNPNEAYYLIRSPRREAADAKMIAEQDATKFGKEAYYQIKTDRRKQREAEEAQDVEAPTESYFRLRGKDQPGDPPAQPDEVYYRLRRNK